MLYHLVGISFSESRYFVVMSTDFFAMTTSYRCFPVPGLERD
jgi:hypothetical protein